MSIHIVGGTGQMGMWLKNFLESQNFCVTVSGRDFEENKDLQKSDIVFVSVPISKAPEVIRKVGSLIKRDALLVDLSSSISETSKTLVEIKKFACCLHLLFGPTVSTAQNQKVILVRISSPRHSGLLRINLKNDAGQASMTEESAWDNKIDYLKRLFEDAGAQVFEMDVAEHEEKIAYLQSLIHFVNIALGKTFSENNIDLTTISTPVSLAQASAITRVLSQSPELLTEIQLANPLSLKILDQFKENIDVLSEEVKNNAESKIKNEIKKLHSIFAAHRTHEKKEITATSTAKLPSEKLKIGYLGPEGTYSYQAAQKVIDKKLHTLIPHHTIYDIFAGAAEGSIDFGVVPAENSTEGTVRETLDYLAEFDLVSVGMVDLPIHHCLISNGHDLSKIKTIISHPQATGQTRKWIEANLPNVEIKHASSTLEMVEKEKNPQIAFIGPEFAAEKYKLHILAKNIEDNPNNITKFYIVSKKTQALDKLSGKTLLFVTVFNRVGVLRDILQIIASFNINLTNIESRPSHEKIWDYYFFIELDIAAGDPKLLELLNILKKYCPVIKVLGSV